MYRQAGSLNLSAASITSKTNACGNPSPSNELSRIVKWDMLGHITMVCCRDWRLT